MRALRVAVTTTVLVTAAVRTLRRHRRQRRIELTEDLRFRVPVGQDPAAVVAKLWVSGFLARTERPAGEETVVITCDPARDRERVRELIAATALNMEGDETSGGAVRFADEETSSAS